MFIPVKDILDPQQSWWGWLIAGGWIAAFMLVIWLINRLLPEKSRKGYRAGTGNALLRAETFFRPSRQNVIEAKQQERKQEEDEGGPEKSG